MTLVFEEHRESAFDYASALYSTCWHYRYTLHREWGLQQNPRHMVAVLLNPSTATAFENDPTTRRMLDFAHRESCGAYTAVNLFAWRDRHPKAMMKVADPIGPDNDDQVREWAERADVLVFGWGNNGRHLDRDLAVIELLDDLSPLCFGYTKSGAPIFPLFQPRTRQFVPYDARRRTR